jgi:hypothetical protein
MAEVMQEVEKTQEELHAAQLYGQLTQMREQLDAYYNYVDMADSMSFAKDDGAPTSGYAFNWGIAYSHGLQRPSATACAYINDMQLRMIRAASRAFAISNPYWRGVEAYRMAYGVGTGHVYTVLPRKESGDERKELCRKVVDEIQTFCKVNKYRKRQEEKLRRLDRDGEFFMRLLDNRDDGILRVRFVEPLLIQTPPGMGPEGNVWFGIKFDGNDYEEPVGYYIRPANYDGGTLTQSQGDLWRRLVPSSMMQHSKANVDMNSPRGLPTTYVIQDRLTQALRTLAAMGKLVYYREKIALIRKRINAVLSTISPILNKNRTGQSSGPGGVLRNIYQLPDAAVVDTNDQATYEFPSQNIETDKIVHSVKADLQSVAAALGIADFMLSADSAGGSFATALVKEGPVEKNVSRMQQDLIDDDLEVFASHLRLAAEHGRLPADALELVQIDVQAPMAIGRNRIQDTQADEILVRNGAMSPETMSMRADLDFFDEKMRREANPPPSEQLEMMTALSGDTRSNQAKMSGKVTGRPFSPGQEAGPKASAQKSHDRPTMPRRPGSDPLRQAIDKAVGTLHGGGAREEEDADLAEHASDTRSNSLPTGEDVAMAAMLITPEWLEKTKREILSLPMTGAPTNIDQMGYYEPGVRGTYIGTVDEQQVWSVDFDALMVKYNAPDLVVAGNSERWPWVPSDKIVVDLSFTGFARAHNVLHECIEYVLMSKGKWAYARAHKMSNTYEQEFLLELRPDLHVLQPQPSM